MLGDELRERDAPMPANVAVHSEERAGAHEQTEREQHDHVDHGDRPEAELRSNPRRDGCRGSANTMTPTPSRSCHGPFHARAGGTSFAVCAISLRFGIVSSARTRIRKGSPVDAPALHG